GQLDLPPGDCDVTVLNAGAENSVSLRDGGSISASGKNDFGQALAPGRLNGISAISSKWSNFSGHSLAVVAGNVIAWGRNYYGECNVPTNLNSVTAVAAGGKHSLALRGDGAIVGWGDDSSGQISGQTNIPGGATVQLIAAGADHSLALL